MAVNNSNTTGKEIIDSILDRFEPSTDPDTNETVDGTTINKSNKSEKTLLQRFFNTLRIAPLRKLLVVITYITDMTLTIFGLWLQKDLPPEIAAGWNVTRVTIYSGYFGSSAAETIVNSNNKTKTIIQSAKQVIGSSKSSSTQHNKSDGLPDNTEVIGTALDGTPIIVDTSDKEP